MIRYIILNDLRIYDEYDKDVSVSDFLWCVLARRRDPKGEPITFNLNGETTHGFTYSLNDHEFS
jgi:hypothetical protein